MENQQTFAEKEASSHHISHRDTKASENDFSKTQSVMVSLDDDLETLDTYKVQPGDSLMKIAY